MSMLYTINQSHCSKDIGIHRGVPYAQVWEEEAFRWEPATNNEYLGRIHPHQIDGIEEGLVVTGETNSLHFFHPVSNNVAYLIEVEREDSNEEPKPHFRFQYYSPTNQPTNLDGCNLVFGQLVNIKPEGDVKRTPFVLFRQSETQFVLQK